MTDGTEFWAHTPNIYGNPQYLLDHLLQTATLTRTFARKFGAEELGYTIGILHDVGKYNPEFQEYLRMYVRDPFYKPDKKLPHAIYGCYLCPEEMQPLQLLIAGHHSGIYSFDKLTEAMSVHKMKSAIVLQNALKFVRQYIKTVALPKKFEGSSFDREVLCRFLFSCLVDADSRDTKAHAKQNQGKPSPIPDINECEAYFTDLYESRMNGKVGTLNTLRRKVYERCCEKAQEAQGVYRLTAPTGSGKTLASLAFGLQHAKRWNLDRVIIAIPYTSIIDQNAAEYRRYLPDNAFLEHHSGIEFDPEEGNVSIQASEWRESASTWGEAVVATTTVQLFESLFANSRSRCRKLHNISNSVIIIDEPQTLPPDLIPSILDMLQTLVSCFGVTVLLCSATQPSLGPTSPWHEKFPSIHEILDRPFDYFEALKRVSYDAKIEDLTWIQLKQKIIACFKVDVGERKQALIVLNTKKDALAVWNEASDYAPFYLSTLLCPAHRKAVIKEINDKLQAGLPCLVVSTQVVEAGVNLDFPIVFRAFGPLDRIVQAAGRCNREGKLSHNGELSKGLMKVFNATEGSIPPGEYRIAIGAARLALRSGKDWHDPDLYDNYFRIFYGSCRQDPRQIQRRRYVLHYPDVAKLFRFFDETSTVIITNYPPDKSHVVELLDRCKKKGFIQREDWQQLQPFTVSLRHNEFEKQIAAGNIIRDFLPGIHIWKGRYHDKLGIADYDLNESTETWKNQ